MSTSRPLSAARPLSAKPKVAPSPSPKPPTRQNRRIQSSYSQPNLHSYASRTQNTNKAEPSVAKEAKKKKVKKKKKAVLVANLALTKYSLGLNCKNIIVSMKISHDNFMCFKLSLL